METLDQLAIKYGADKSSQYHGYTEYYAPLFEPHRTTRTTLLEIGVQFGPSIRTWLAYFTHPYTIIYGTDVAHAAEHLKDITDPRFRFVMADQGDRPRMSALAFETTPLDIVVDDGCHMASHMKASMECLWPAVASDGLYIIEDCFALWHKCGASNVDGPAWLGSFIGDVNLHGKEFHGRPDPLPKPVILTVNEATIKSVTFTRGLAIFRKK
jgi:hypothetical protein